MTNLSLNLNPIANWEQSHEMSGRAIIEGTYCQYGDEVKPDDLVAANFDMKHVHTGGGLYLLEKREGNRVKWSGCRRMIRTPAGIEIDQDGHGDWVTVADMAGTGFHVVGAVETVYRPTRYQ